MSQQDNITIRECVSVKDFLQCVELEKSVWKDDDLGIMPVRMYMISRACNAPTIGAFDPSDRLLGFVHTSIAIKQGHVVYHSHLAAVLEDMRHRDIGFRMKLAQRERAIELGIPLIMWTFDPLQSRNAHLNISKLGAIIRRYEVDYYPGGISRIFESDVPSDRVFAEWWVSSPHVTSVLSGSKATTFDAGSVEIPDDIEATRKGSLEEHLRWRLQVRSQFQKELSKGTIVRGFVRQPETRTSRYAFGPDDNQFQFKSTAGLRVEG
jgi:predicted GNAT superfamily acetyltransferase